MSRIDPRILDELLDDHPEVQRMEVTPHLRPLYEAAPHLGRFFIGWTEKSGHPIVSALRQVAPAEMGLARGLCKGHLMRTVTTTTSILLHLSSLFRPEDGGDDDSGDKSSSESAPGGDGQEEEAQEEGEGAAEGLPQDLDPSQMVDEAFEEVAAQTETLDQLDDLLPGLAWGSGRGHLEAALMRDMGLMANLMAQIEQLRQIADELGRLERSARRSDPRRGGRSTVTGVRVGGELSEVLPGELALLGDASTEDLFYQRYIERRLLSLEMEGTMDAQDDHAGRRGPVIACVDTSGSMSGRPELIAKALILAIMRQVLPQGRRVRLMLFGGPGEFTDMDMGRSVGAMRQLLEFLTLGFHSGTDFDGPLERAMTLLEAERYEDADVLVITDGYAHASEPIVARARQVHDDTGAHFVSVVVGDHPGGVDAFSDQVWLIPRQGSLEDHIDLRRWNRPPEP